jgi:O-methyltransferase involved in polyketide biosynthesis
LEVSSSIAAARATESSRPDALFQDPYAAALCSQQPSSNSSSSGSAGASSNLPSAQQVAMDVIATQYIDESLLNAMDATSINSIQAGDYR